MKPVLENEDIKPTGESRQTEIAEPGLIAAAPSLYTFLQKIYLDYEDDCECECNTETCCAVVGEPCAKCHAFIALSLVDETTKAEKPVEEKE